MAKVGRPTKLTRKMLNAAQAYIDENLALSGIALLPTIERLASRLGVHRDTLQEWDKLDTPLGHEFSVMLESLRQEQADKLIQRGLEKRYESSLVRLLLSKHGYVDKQAVEHSGDGLFGTNELTVKVIDARTNPQP